ncbi:MAG: hypothetical protein E7329_06415 [Clostridiales bacterium]|nr:hypothetical protein [Clostridiales bacterium]
MPLARRRDYTPLLLIAAMILMWALLHIFMGGDALGPSLYNTYTLQALAWRQGELHLPHDYPHLELAIFEGDYYVSFPPLPSVILYPLTFLFGAQTPDNFLVKLYALMACLAMYYALRNAGYSRLSASFLSFFFSFSSSLLPMTMQGAVWYHAQVLAFLMVTLSICLLALDFTAPALLFYALSVACRPFHALYALPLFFTYWIINRRAGVSLVKMARSLMPGIGLGLCVAAALALYNLARFGNPLEFGHNYLPEFSFQGGVQFSVSHVLNHLKTFLWGLPLEISNGALAFKKFGYSLFIACPTLTLMMIWLVIDCFKKRMRWEKAVIFLTFLLHLFCLLLHRTFGGFQLGARYAVDLIPYSFFYLLLTPEKKKLALWEGILLGAIFIFTMIGMTQVHI